MQCNAHLISIRNESECEYLILATMEPFITFILRLILPCNPVLKQSE